MTAVTSIIQKARKRVRCYIELSLQQQAISVDYIDSTVFSKRHCFSLIIVTLHQLSLALVKISALFLLLYYKYLAINTSSVKVTVRWSSV